MHMHVAREGGGFTTRVHEYVRCTQGEIESRQAGDPPSRQIMVKERKVQKNVMGCIWPIDYLAFLYMGNKVTAKLNDKIGLTLTKRDEQK